MVADKSVERIARNGFCLWKCQALNGEVIAIVRNKGYKPPGFKGVVYTERELVMMCESDSVLLVHEARKEGFSIQDGEEID